MWQWAVTAFGELEPTTAETGWIRPRIGSAGQRTGTAPVSFDLRFPGQQYDRETGLYYNHHRYYDPYLTVGYTEDDPLGLEAGWNRFVYVGGDPLSFVDPKGLAAPAAACGAAPASCIFVLKICKEIIAKVLPKIVGIVGGKVLIDVSDDCKGKYCQPDNKCDELLKEVGERAALVRAQYFANMLDFRNLYEKTYCVPNTGKRYGTWIGHEQKLRDYIQSLRKAIDAADAAGCPVDPGDRALLALEVLRCPAS